MGGSKQSIDLNRRDFIKHAGLVTGILALTPLIPVVSLPVRPFKVGVLLPTSKHDPSLEQRVLSAALDRTAQPDQK